MEKNNAAEGDLQQQSHTRSSPAKGQRKQEKDKLISALKSKRSLLGIFKKMDRATFEKIKIALDEATKEADKFFDDQEMKELQVNEIISETVQRLKELGLNDNAISEVISNL
ncbi:hypothetical protein ABCL16_003461 [Vibrio parahaemolyticus]